VNEKPQSRLPLSIRIGWGLGAVGSTIFLFSKSLILRFMTDELGVAAAAAGFLFAISKIYDAATDPVIGIISDKTDSRWGRRRPYLLAGALLCATTFVLLFTVPDIQSSRNILIYMGALLLLFATAYTLFNVAHVAMPVEMTSNYQERSELFAYRAGAIGLGSILGGFLGPLIIAAYGGGRTGHEVMSWVLGTMVFVAMTGCFWMTRRAPFRQKQTTIRYSLAEQLTTALSNRPYLILMIVKVFLLVTATMNSGTAAYFTSKIMNLSDRWLGIYFLCYGLALLLSQPVWLRVVRTFGKRRTYIATALCYALVAMSWTLADQNEHLALFVLRAIGIGWMTGAVMLATQSMLPETIDYDYRRTGLTREGLFTGFYTTVEKLGVATGVAITGIVLGTMGYVASTGGEVVTQPASAIKGIYLCFGVIPAVLITVSCLVVSMYNLDEQKLNTTQRITPGSG
jgi:GPH family glycoside/pentoside/hexuronide:cation symporter